MEDLLPLYSWTDWTADTTLLRSLWDVDVETFQWELCKEVMWLKTVKKLKGCWQRNYILFSSWAIATYFGKSPCCSLFIIRKSFCCCQKNFLETKCQCVLIKIVAHQLGIGIRIASLAETNVEVYNVILAKRSSCNNTAQY